MRTRLFAIAAAALVVAITIFATTAHAWWCTGHMLVAEIARSSVEKRIADNADLAFQHLAQWGPFPEAPDMVNGACWADDVKGYGLEAMSPWHFVNQVYDPSNFDFQYRGCPIQKANAADLLGGMVDAAKKAWYKPWVVSFALAYVVHLFGDIHQPLHCTDLFSQNFTTGDRGGNLIKVTWPENTEITELHAFWDSVCGRYTTREHRPLNSTNYEWLKKDAERIKSSYNVSEKSANEYDGWFIANQSYDLAKNYSYKGVLVDNVVQSMPVTLTKDYQSKCIPVAEKQILRAGLRLASSLKYIFKDAPEVTTSTAAPTVTPTPCPTPTPGPSGTPSSTTTVAPDTTTTTTSSTPSSTAAPGTPSPHSDTNHSTAAPAPPPPSDQWNSKATGAFFGGFFTGVGIVLLGWLVNKYMLGKSAHTAIQSGNLTGGSTGYSDISQA